MVCGKGGYVRSIARDLGAALGCLGHVVGLRRLWSGPFDLDGALDAATLERLARLARARRLAAAGRRRPRRAAGAAAPTPSPRRALRHGNPAALAGPGPLEGAAAWASADGLPLAVGEWRGGMLRPERVFVFD